MDSPGEQDCIVLFSPLVSAFGQPPLPNPFFFLSSLALWYLTQLPLSLCSDSCLPLEGLSPFPPLPFQRAPPPLLRWAWVWGWESTFLDAGCRSWLYGNHFPDSLLPSAEKATSRPSVWRSRFLIICLRLCAVLYCPPCPPCPQRAPQQGGDAPPSAIR